MTQVARLELVPGPAASSAPLSRGTLTTVSSGGDVIAQLVAETAKKNELAFARLYKLISGRLLSVALGILRQRAAAEDALQESFLRIWRSAHTFDPEKGTGYAWLVTIVRNRALSQKASLGRDIQRHEDLDFESIPCEGPDVVSSMIDSDEARRVRTCVEKLPLNNRRSMELVYFEGLTHRELAERLQVPIGTAKSWVRRGLDQLGQCMRGHPSNDWRELVAREYAIGTLQGAARRGFERRRERDARYCASADWWEGSLAMLTLFLKESDKAPAGLWREICRKIGNIASAGK